MNEVFHSIQDSILLLVGLLVLLGFYAGRASGLIKLPSIIGYMITGLICGPSLLDLLNIEIQHDLSFITEISLGFVAFSIGLELSFNSLKNQGIGIISIILAESFAAFLVVTFGVYMLTRNLPLSLAFGALAPASAPAGTVAVIKEYKAKGSLTKALYAVVGFDDGLAIIIFGFAASIIRMLLTQESTGEEISILESLWVPIKEIALSIGFGGAMSAAIALMARKLKNNYDLLILIVASVLIVNGLCTLFHLSLILTNMVIGLVIVNTQRHELVHKISEQLSDVMPLFFVLFFILAGAHLQIAELPSMGWLGVVYIICRSVGLMGGARLGGTVGKVEDKVKKYVGMGILSQAGVAIGLALIISHDFKGVGKVVKIIDGHEITTGDLLGATAITTITATCIFFEVIGPILTKIALTKAGEIQPAKQ
jgi:Kef-type K+ transport system membrane component KefB